MADFSLVGGAAKILTAGIDLSNTRGVQVTSGGANTKGSWAELEASTDFESNRIIVTTNHEITSTSASTMLLDIAVGGAGSEQVVAENLIYSQSGQTTSAVHIFDIPIKIPVGVRVSARLQSNAATRRSGVTAFLVPTSFSSDAGLSIADDYGITTASTDGTDIDPGGTANTKGSWVEIASSTTSAYKGFFIGITTNKNNNVVQARWLYDVAVGASGSEEIILENSYIGANTVETYAHIQNFYPVQIASGQRIAIRSQCNITDATDRVFAVGFYGVR